MNSRLENRSDTNTFMLDRVSTQDWQQKLSIWDFVHVSMGKSVTCAGYESNQPRPSVHFLSRLEGPQNHLLKGYDSISLRLHHVVC